MANFENCIAHLQRLEYEEDQRLKALLGGVNLNGPNMGSIQGLLQQLIASFRQIRDENRALVAENGRLCDNYNRLLQYVLAW